MTHHKWGRFPPSLLLLLPPLPAAEVLRGSRLVNMATAGATGDDLRKELTCAICLDFFKDPVILKCGHNFCRFCICMHWDENGGDYGYQCPQCRTVSLWTLSVFSTMFGFFFSEIYIGAPATDITLNCMPVNVFTIDKPLNGLWQNDTGYAVHFVANVAIIAS